MPSKVKRVIEVVRARVERSPDACIVCRGRVSRSDASIQMHAGAVHARCARYRPRRTPG